MRVFIASPSGELQRYRDRVIKACVKLDLDPVHMKDFPPDRAPPLETCRRMVESCDVFVLLLAHRYGDRPPGRRRSYTELEYEWALKRPDMKIFPLVVEPDFAWPPTDVAVGADRDALDRFKKRVTTRHSVRWFSDQRSFKKDVLGLLTEHVQEQPGGGVRRDPRVARVPSPPVFHTVPPYVGGARFTGRRADLETLDDWGRSDDPVLVVDALGGSGKSALTWEWAQQRAPEVVDELAGRLWWSFYDGSASMTRFLREVLAYVSGRSLDDVRGWTRSELATEVLGHLRARPYLLVLDGFERLLKAYHTFDPAKLRDDEVDPKLASLIEPEAWEFVYRLAGAAPSKILISTRLMPDALVDRFRKDRPLAGVEWFTLRGLSDADTVTLLSRLDVHGDGRRVTEFFRGLDNHPLVVCIVAGIVRDYRPAPGRFDRWLEDPEAGGALKLAGLELTARQNHILAVALDGLPPEHRRLLGWISVLSGAVKSETLEKINPFRSDPPDGTYATLARDPPPLSFEGDVFTWAAALERHQLDAEREAEEARAASVSPARRARDRTRLLDALDDLEERGLLWWDRATNTYDLHPLVRAYVADQVDGDDRLRANRRARDYFAALPPRDDLEAPAGVEDLSDTIGLFRALVGAGEPADACALWRRRLSDLLGAKLAAYETVVELLTAPALRDEPTLLTDLGLAYRQLRRYDEALATESQVLVAALHRSHVGGVQVSLTRIGAIVRDAGSLVGFSRCIELRGELAKANGEPADGWLLFHRGVLAELQGRDDGVALLDSALQRGAPDEPWFSGDVRLTQLLMRLHAGIAIDEDDLVAAAAAAEYPHQRLGLAAIRHDLHWREDRFDQALEAALEVERLENDAHIESAPAARAVLLAKLSRLDDAHVAVEESLARLGRIHPAARPHLHLARALHELGRSAEARLHAREAYKQAWGEGPPFAWHWMLMQATEVLRLTGEAPAELPCVEPGSIEVPHEARVRAFIAMLSEPGIRFRAR